MNSRSQEQKNAGQPLLAGYFLRESCWGKAMLAFTKRQQGKKGGDRLTGERSQIKFIYLRFEREKVVSIGK